MVILNHYPAFKGQFCMYIRSQKTKKYSYLAFAVLMSLLLFTSRESNAQEVFADPLPPESSSIEFSGIQWYMKAGEGLGPRNNDWSDSEESVFVDEMGRLHLKIRQIEGIWHSAEVSTVLHAGYGIYRFIVDSPLHQLDREVVLGMFLYRDDNTEIDIEISRWGEESESEANALYTVQPYILDGHMHAFNMSYPESTIYEIDWQVDSLIFRTYKNLPSTSDEDSLIEEWQFDSGDFPVESDDLHLHINLYLLGDAPSNEEEVEIIISRVEALLKPTLTMSVTDNIVEGTVSPSQYCTDDYRIVLYAKTDIYYVQPTTLNPSVEINADCTWQTTTNSSDFLVAHLVTTNFIPPEQINVVECPPLNSEDIIASICPDE